MASEKFKIVSMSMKPDMEATLKVAAKRMGCSVSQLVRVMVETYLPLLETPEVDEMLKEGAKQSGHPVPELLKALIVRHLNLIVKNDKERAIKLTIPAELADNEAELRKWLSVRTEAIVKALKK